MSKKKAAVNLGDVILLGKGSNIGVVKYIGPLKGQDDDYLGIQLHEGSGDCNGSFRGISYFKCENNKGTFITPKEVKKIITPEELLRKVMVINKKFKGANAEISKLKDQLKFSLEKEQQAREDLLSMSNAETETKKQPDTDEDVKKFLAKELGKKWYVSFDDLCTRYRKREKKELGQIYRKVEERLNQLPTVAHHTRIVYTVTASNLDNLIATGSDDKSIRLWRINYKDTSLRCTAKLESRSCINSLAFSPDGLTLAAALDSGWIELYDIMSGKNVGSLEGQSTSEVWTIAFSPDGKNLISGSLDRSVRIWNVKQRDCNWALRGHDEWVNGVAVAPNGTSIISCSGDKTVKVWDTRNMNCKTTLRGHGDFVRSVCVMRDSKTIVSASDDAMLRVWDLDEQCMTAQLAGHEKGIYCVSEGPGNLIVSASRDQTVRVWDVAKKQGLCTFKEHGGDVNSCCFVGDGAYVVSGSDDKTVQCSRLRLPAGYLASHRA